MPIMAPDDDAKVALDKLNTYLQEFGRQRSEFGLEAWLRFGDDDPQAWASAAEGWRALGADYAMLYPMWRIADFEGQLELLQNFKEAGLG
jgi:hypothetical protein